MTLPFTISLDKAVKKLNEIETINKIMSQIIACADDLVNVSRDKKKFGKK